MNTGYCQQPFRAGLLALLVALIAGCGAGGVGPIAGGGIGGTGITSGTVTGFGSVIVNARIHETDNSTQFLRNGAASTEDAFRVGDVVFIEWESDPEGTTRKALRVEYQRAIYGEVTGTPDPATGTLEVVGQAVTAGANTLFDEFSSPAPAGQIFPQDLDVGVCVDISGLQDAAGNLFATRIERVDAPCAAQTEIRGVVTSAVGELPTRITVSGTPVDLPADVAIEPSPVALTTGAFVTVEGGYGNGVLSASRIQVRTDDFTDLDDERADIEGLISNLSRKGSAATFTVSGIPVSAADTIEYENGTFTDLADNLRIEVEGDFVGGVLAAEEIEFKLDGQVEIESILLSADAGSLTLDFGADVVVVRTDPLITRFSDDTGTAGLTLADLREGDYVKIVGYVDDPTGDAATVATLVELEQIGGSDDGDIEDRVLQGPITDVSERPGAFSVLGVAISTSGLAECEGDSDETILCSDLVESLAIGDIVEVQGSSSGAGGWIEWDELELED